tara:strand:- start:108202 stop:110157 length:1956 start_codon:yes stop_codon:yes gene_type:complete
MRTVLPTRSPQSLHRLAGFGLFALLASLVMLATPRVAEAQSSQRVYVRAIPDRATFEDYSRVLGTDRFSKFIIDVKTDEIYFIDVNVFKIHADFVLGVLLKQAWTADNIREYNKNYKLVKPRFILGYLTEHLKVDKMSFAFWEGDEIDAKGVLRVYKKLQKTFYKKDLLFRPDSPAQELVAKAVARKNIKTITNDALYKESPYQAFNKGSSVGTLRVVPRNTPYESLIFEREDIVILQESYPDISPVSGIMSMVFSTPLSHVNLRATAWGIPNAGYRKANADYKKLDGKVVFYEVGDREHTLRLATKVEIASYQQKRKQRRIVPVPPADLETANMPMLTALRAGHSRTYGSKTANLGEIASAGLADVNVPKGFGLPFFYYQRHLAQNGLDASVRTLLSDPKMREDARYRKAALAKIREAILAAPMDSEVLDAIYKRVRLKLGSGGVFVRSSTNAEDLPGFNGAGLYDTVPNVRGKKNLEIAVKTVWASLWNYHAYEERDLFGIEHTQVYAGVLIQTGVNATAAGVLITTNLYNPEDDNGFTINAKSGLGMRVVEGTKIPEQIIFDTVNDGTKIISRSDDPFMLVFDSKGGIQEVENPHRGVILSEERAKRLAKAVLSFEPLFSSRHALDVEWLLEGEKVWIVQARPYVESH